MPIPLLFVMATTKTKKKKSLERSIYLIGWIVDEKPQGPIIVWKKKEKKKRKSAFGRDLYDRFQFFSLLFF